MEAAQSKRQGVQAGMKTFDCYFLNNLSCRCIAPPTQHVAYILQADRNSYQHPYLPFHMTSTKKVPINRAQTQE